MNSRSTVLSTQLRSRAQTVLFRGYLHNMRDETSKSHSESGGEQSSSHTFSTLPRADRRISEPVRRIYTI